MKKTYLWMFGLLALSACSKNNGETGLESSALGTSETIVQTSDSSSEEENSSEQTKTDFPYAVNLDDFSQEVVVNGESKKIEHLTFSSNQSSVLNSIVLNLKDLNKLGKAIYLTTKEAGELFYPVSIKTVPTKKISVLGLNGEKRTVEVNTELSIEEDEGNQNVLDIVGDKYFLFYNEEGTISLAIRNFSENAASEKLDPTNMVEYVQQDAQNNTEESTQNGTSADHYYDSIKAAWQKQKEYIDSITDQKVKQSVQTTNAAATAEATRLEMENPSDAKVIQESLKKVLSGN